MPAASPQSARPLARLVLVGALVPAAFAWLDHLSLRQLSARPTDDWLAGWTAALFIVRVGVFGILCGKLIESPVWRWLIYGWCWLLVDLQTLSAAVFSEPHFNLASGAEILVTSLLAAQTGLVAIWAMLGTTRWVVRWPASLFITGMLVASSFVLFSDADLMRLLFTQMLALIVICGVLRWQRYRLVVERPAPGDGELTAGAELRLNQFGLSHMLVWISSLALALAIARSLDLFSSLDLSTWDGQRRFTALSTGIAAAIVLVVALWAGLGAGAAWLRWTLLIGVTLFTGLTLALTHHFASNWNWPYFRSYTAEDHWQVFARDSLWLITWIALAGGLLFATLLMPRALGYRLVRTAQLTATA